VLAAGWLIIPQATVGAIPSRHGRTLRHIPLISRARTYSCLPPSQGVYFRPTGKSKLGASIPRAWRSTSPLDRTIWTGEPRFDRVAAALPQFLLSYNDLSELHLQNIPNLGYITPEAMVTVLSALTKLTYLEIGFQRPEEILLAQLHQRM
jgi:hypothetical protein